MNEKDTYGSIMTRHNARELSLEDDVIEYRKAMEPDIVKNIENTVQNALREPQYSGKDFYIVLLMKVERIGGAPRTLVLARQSCPTPVYKQSVWKYHRASGSLEFLWSIPDGITYYHILRNKDKFLLDKELSQLTQFVLLMESGELLEWVKKENGEKIDAVIKITKETPCTTT